VKAGRPRAWQAHVELDSIRKEQKFSISSIDADVLALVERCVGYDKDKLRSQLCKSPMRTLYRQPFSFINHVNHT